eukprot:7819279-Pyramimonas_sp.AAC.1
MAPRLVSSWDENGTKTKQASSSGASSGKESVPKLRSASTTARSLSRAAFAAAAIAGNAAAEAEAAHAKVCV